MDDSGDEFVWQEMINDRVKDTTSSSSMEDSDAEKEYKKNLHKELFKVPKIENNLENHETKNRKSKKSKYKDLNSSTESGSSQLTTVKAEPESDIDSAKRKTAIKKVKNSHEESMDIDNSSYLDLLVKEESNDHKKHKKKKRKKSESASQEDLLDDSLICEDDSHMFGSVIDVKSELDNSNKKKKKKKKKEKDSLLETKESIVKELFSEEETVVASQVVDHDVAKKPKKIKTNSKSSQSPNVKIHSNSLIYEDEIMNPATQNGCLDNSGYSEQTSHKKHGKTKSPGLTRKERNPRISDRILFEEEEDSQIEATHIDKTEHTSKSYKLQQYLKTHGNLKKIQLNPSSDYTITSDDEVWVLKCPSDFKVSSLENVNFPLNSNKFKIKIDSQTYDADVDLEVNKHPILSYNKGKCIVQNVTLQGLMTLRRRIPKALFIEDTLLSNIQSESFIPLPDTKCRHPLFGLKYKKQIKLAVAIQDLLSGHNHNVTPPASEKKKKKKYQTKLKCKDEEISSAVEKITETREERRARKRARQELEEQPAAKRARHVPAWDCEQEIQDHLFNH